MCEEIKQELLKAGDYTDPLTGDVRPWLNEYSLAQVKEKFGTLRWYDNGFPADTKIEDIISKYEDRSMMICICCGRPAKYVTNGWVSYQCEKCFKKHELSKKMSKIEKNTMLMRSKMYIDDIPYRTLYNRDGTITQIQSPYLEEMKKIWPDKRPDTFDIDLEINKK